jgi:RND family efflux transporter MFP subunit
MTSTIYKRLFVLVAVAAAFGAGMWHESRKMPRAAAPGGRRILYYHDPMHPSYKSNKPGIAPDCGMQLEPVYAGEGEAPAPGTIHVSVEAQQIIGVRTEEAAQATAAQPLRVLGRVAVDETRIYRVNAAIDGWIRDVYPFTAGSLVRKDQPLAVFYTPEFLGAEQAYIFAQNSMDRFQQGKETPEQLALTRANIQSYADALRNLGMSDVQIAQLAKTRQLTEKILLTAPADGFLLARNVSLGQRFEKGTELYRIADLRHVWIVADLYESERDFLKPGQRVDVRYHGQPITARVAESLPQFDPASRTLKVRLEADNPGYLLRPDMFVDMEIPGRRLDGLTVPADAVIDSGLRKTVYVERADGAFQAREVETGQRAGARIEISRGLASGERVVVAGNFLLDSETRMKAAALAAAAAELVKDPVCGMDIDPAKAAGTSKYKGQTYWFCSKSCKSKFDGSPDKYVKPRPPAGTMARLGHTHD